jgi:drug/metabolite transporter (DMT)-like permease
LNVIAITGGWAALIAALLWSIAAVIFGGLAGQISPLGLNLAKGLVAITFLSLTMALNDRLLPAISPTISLVPLLILLASGVIGIGIGDTFYFAALHQIGARRTLLMKILAPPIAAIVSFGLLGEQLTGLACLGMAVTIVGVAWVISERNRDQSVHPNPRGILFAFLAALTDAIGAVLSRMALSESSIDPLWSAWVRLVGGAIIVGMLIVWQRQPIVLPTKWGEAKTNMRRLVLTIVIVSFFSTYLGIWLQQVALKTTAAGIAQTLGATSPLFVLPIVALQGERVTIRSVLGASVALVGIGILLLLGMR